MASLKLEDPPNNMTADSNRRHADTSTNFGPLVPADRMTRRLLLGLLASMLFNAAIWTMLSAVVRSHLIEPRPPLTFKLVTLPTPPKHRKIIPPKPPKTKPVPKSPLTPVPLTPARSTHAPPPPNHLHVITATGPAQGSGTAQTGGTAPVGVPAVAQPAAPTAPSPTAPPAAVANPAPPAPAQKPVPPAKVGPTEDARSVDEVMPNIPDSLLNDDYKSHVLVRVEVAADGSFTPLLVTSSGNSDVDACVLEALKKWKWKPALQNGIPLASSQRFRFDFEVQ